MKDSFKNKNTHGGHEVNVELELLLNLKSLFHKYSHFLLNPMYGFSNLSYLENIWRRLKHSISWGFFWQNNEHFFTSLGHLSARIMYTYLPNMCNTGMIDLKKVIDLVWQLFFLMAKCMHSLSFSLLDITLFLYSLLRRTFPLLEGACHFAYSARWFMDNLHI